MSTQNKTEAQALAPCPFCGASASGYAIEPHSHALKLGDWKMADHLGSYVIEGDCACGSGLIGETQEEVTARWNRRATPPASAHAQVTDERAEFDKLHQRGTGAPSFCVWSKWNEIEKRAAWEAWQARAVLALAQQGERQAEPVDNRRAFASEAGQLGTFQNATPEAPAPASGVTEEAGYTLLSELAGIDTYDTSLRDQPAAYDALDRYRAAILSTRQADGAKPGAVDSSVSNGTMAAAPSQPVEGEVEPTDAQLIEAMRDEMTIYEDGATVTDKAQLIRAGRRVVALCTGARRAM